MSKHTNDIPTCDDSDTPLIDISQFNAACPDCGAPNIIWICGC